MQYIFESTFARIFLFLERTLEQETRIYINLHQFARFKYSVTALFVFVKQRLYSDWPFKTVCAEPKNSWRSKNRKTSAKVDS